MSRKAADYDCEKCTHHHCGDGRPGDRGPTDWMSWELPDGTVSRSCLLPMLTDESMQWLRLYRQFEHGNLAVSGGLLEQPAAYMQAMEIIENGKG